VSLCFYLHVAGYLGFFFLAWFGLCTLLDQLALMRRQRSAQ
jgi:hypothetical protein